MAPSFAIATDAAKRLLRSAFGTVAIAAVPLAQVASTGVAQTRQ